MALNILKGKPPLSWLSLNQSWLHCDYIKVISLALSVCLAIAKPRVVCAEHGDDISSSQCSWWF